MVNDEFDNDKHSQATDLLNTGISELFKKNYDNSIEFIEKASELFSEINDLSNVALCNAELAIAYYKKSSKNLSKSYLLLYKANDICKNIPQYKNVGAKVTHCFGKLYFYEKQFTEALVYYTKALKQAEDNSLELANIYESIAIFYLRFNNYQISHIYTQKALNIKTEIGNKTELAFTELLYGRSLLNIEDYDNASIHLNNALTLSEEFKSDFFRARILEELAKINIYTENYDDAENYCKEAITVSQCTDSKLLIAFSLSTLAYIKALKWQNDKALEIISQVTPIFKESNLIRGEAYLYQSKGIVCLNMGHPDKAIEHFDNCRKIYEKLAITKELARSHFYLAKAYKQKRDIQSSLSNTLEAMNIARMFNYPVLASKIEVLLFYLVNTELDNIAAVSIDKQQSYSSLLNNLSAREIMPYENLQDPLISLLKIGKVIYNETDHDKILAIAASETQKAMNADRCSIFLYDKDTQELYSRMASGMDDQEIRFPASLGMAGYVFVTGEIVKIDDAYSNPIFNKEVDEKTGYKTKSILCIPMRNSNQEIIGVFEVINKLGNEVFTEKDLELLVSISSSVGASLENASLLKEQVLMYKEQKKSFISFINALAASIDARDKITAGHSTRVTSYALIIADQLGWDKDEKEVLEYSAILHDIGKIGIRDEVLCKEGKLTDKEYKHIQEHSRITFEILDKMYFEEKLKKVPEIAASHHEKYNGTGYHRGLAGEDIPIGGRIIAVADVFDAITSKRHYRDRMPFKQALSILKGNVGSHFDNKIVDIFFKINLGKIAETLSSRSSEPLSPEDMEILNKVSINDIYIALNKEDENLSDNEKTLIQIFSKHYCGQ